MGTKQWRRSFASEIDGAGVGDGCNFLAVEAEIVRRMKGSCRGTLEWRIQSDGTPDAMGIPGAEKKSQV